MRATYALIALFALAGCGIEVAGTAAVVGTAQVQNTEQAKQQMDQVEKRLDAAQRDMQQRLAAEDGKSTDSVAY